MIFNSFNSEMIIFATIFLLLTFLIKFALTRNFMRNNSGTASIIAICISLLASYGIIKTNFYNNFLASINLDSGFLINVLPLLIIALLILITLKWGLGIVLLILSGIFLVSGFGNFVYSKTFFLIIGFVLAPIGFWLVQFRNRRRRYKRLNAKDREIYKRERRANRKR